MNILAACPNRIKPKLLREMKTEALLVFIRTTLEEYFYQLDNQAIQYNIGSDEDVQYISSTLRDLLHKLQECVVSSTYLRSLIANMHKNSTLRIIAKKEEPLMVYYDSIIKALEVNMHNGQPWMPELMVIALLSEWIIEEEKSVFLYPFLGNINYLELLTIYEKTKLNLEEEKREIIMNMYKISSNLILKLKLCTYKMNSRRKKKKRQ
ncbi:MAG: hypothetical protein ACNI3C_11955 [Candidatus Marinarcus sp.]|uniref:hypothetical protein n=1 Tax=Candidatus Marinarcus sp. TaxID=3100987 RepID=UPI003AFF6A6E